MKRTVPQVHINVANFACLPDGTYEIQKLPKDVVYRAMEHIETKVLSGWKVEYARCRYCGTQSGNSPEKHCTQCGAELKFDS